MPGESGSRQLAETIYNNDCVSRVSSSDRPQYNNVKLTRKIRSVGFRKGPYIAAIAKVWLYIDVLARNAT